MTRCLYALKAGLDDLAWTGIPGQPHILVGAQFGGILALLDERREPVRLGSSLVADLGFFGLLAGRSGRILVPLFLQSEVVRFDSTAAGFAMASVG